MTELIACTDEHFAWMLGEATGPPHLSLPPGGMDDPTILKLLRNMALRVRAVHGGGTWMMAAANEVVGLCGYKWPAQDGAVEIGYGVAQSRRRRGHATRAVAAMMAEAMRDPLVRLVTAETAVENRPSQRALEENGFVKTGARVDDEDGELILWRYQPKSEM